MRVARSERGGNNIFAGRTLFVGCPLGARPVSSARFGVASTFAFLAVVFDPMGFSPSESASAFRLLELAARFGGIDKNKGVTCVANKEERGRERERGTTKLRKRYITGRDARLVDPLNLRNDGDYQGVNHSPRDMLIHASLERGWKMGFLDLWSLLLIPHQGETFSPSSP